MPAGISYRHFCGGEVYSVIPESELDHVIDLQEDISQNERDDPRLEEELDQLTACAGGDLLVHWDALGFVAFHPNNNVVSFSLPDGDHFI